MAKIKVALVGVGNCSGSLIEGLAFYGEQKTEEGLLFPVLGGYRLEDIEIVCAFDISKDKVDHVLEEAIYAKPNNFQRIDGVKVDQKAPVYRGPTLDGNPDHLKVFVTELEESPCDVTATLKKHEVDIVVNLLPTGSDEATEFYGTAALDAGCAFINCIPTIYAQREEVQKKFADKKLPVIGDDIKSQVGSTIIHRSILTMLHDRGAIITKSSQINIGGNTDFANFVYRAHTKLVSKFKSLSQFISPGTPNHIGHHYDLTKGPFKKTLFDIEATVFAKSKVKISVQLESDDKPNSAGSVIDLIRIAQHEKVQGNGGCVYDACAYYNKSAPTQMLDREAYGKIKQKWGENN